MLTNDEIVFKINNSDSKLIFIVGDFEDFSAYNLAMDYNYSYLQFDDFLKENNIDSKHFQESDYNRKTTTPISIDKWTQKIAFKEQKLSVIIDGFSSQKIPDYLTRNLLMQELLHLSKNSSKLKTNLVFVIDTKHGKAESHILPKILDNSTVIFR